MKRCAPLDVKWRTKPAFCTSSTNPPGSAGRMSKGLFESIFKTKFPAFRFGELLGCAQVVTDDNDVNATLVALNELYHREDEGKSTNAHSKNASVISITRGSWAAEEEFGEPRKMSHSSAEHGAATHEEALGTARKGLTAGLEGWWRKGGGGCLGPRDPQ